MVVKLMAVLSFQTALFLIIGHVVLGNQLEAASDAVIKSIQSEDGDVIDCVDIYKQPALNHPALRNHKIQMEPSYVPPPTIDQTTRKINRAKGKENKESKWIKQIWHKNGSCPQGTVPIRRKTQTKDKALPIVSRTNKSSFNLSKHELSQSNKGLLRPNHAMSFLGAKGEYLGARGDIAVYNPSVERFDEYTLSDISVENGDDHNFEAVRSGWMVNPTFYGDKQTRLFTYWTADGSQNTGCFDYVCPGFVQVNNDIALGAAIEQISKPSYNEPAQVMKVLLYKDLATDHWWVSVDDKNIGYWPKELFRKLSYEVERVQWGGDVYSTRLETQPHTATAMGSGAYSSPTDWLTGSIRRIKVLLNTTVWAFPNYAYTYADQVKCYDFYIQLAADDPIFYYGGPGSGGQASKCQ
ncbi:OLC1v1029162C1 [Oldenlandia corymbosa var. corymbosa]|uniref:OLC1v1029162C1 n=1 Tax=Oldenlandia corymbosa var. corymbosa TaxID=529605 RepID=A0AAV1CFA2_OLDCO|nr:OLC1v1029162C1 [Oldenlandia corymbosa var. corymbosa]